ncbi:hypothetical protein [Amycolatopsis magusensis]
MDAVDQPLTVQDEQLVLDGADRRHRHEELSDLAGGQKSVPVQTGQGRC